MATRFTTKRMGKYMNNEEIIYNAFGGDRYIFDEVSKLVTENNIKTIIETGTYKAETTLALRLLCTNIHSIEINETYYNRAVENNKNKINFHLGNSPKILKEILPNIERPILFFLDAHWYDYNPLLDELKVIAEFGLQDSIILIHDFKVPNKDFGFDSFNGKDYDLDYIRESIESIFPNGYNHYYNERTTNIKRGIIYISGK
jgi:hypothetical protein